MARQCVQATVAGPPRVRRAVRLALVPLPLLPPRRTEKVRHVCPGMAAQCQICPIKSRSSGDIIQCKKYNY